MRLRDISKGQAHLLASIFHRPSSEPEARYAERVYCLESQLDRHLLRPDFLHRLIQLPQSHRASLCWLHKILDAKVVHQIFLLVATEVGLRMNKLVVAGRDQLGHETWDRSILNLRSLHGAWLPTEVFWDTFGETLDVSRDGFSGEDYMTKWVDEKNKCEACILTKIGSDLDTVFDLEMAVRSRTHTNSVRRYREPRLMKLIEGWLRRWEPHYAADKWRDKLEWNRVRAARVKDFRRAIRKEERRNKAKQGGRTECKLSHRPARVTAPIIEHKRQRPQADKAVMNNRIFVTRTQVEPPNPRTELSATKHMAPEQAEVSDDEDEDIEIRNTLYNTENEIIDSHAALISTPFLPGMGVEEHERRASRLSQYSTPTYVDQKVQASWPMVGRSIATEGLSRSQSTTHRRPSNYSESVYSQTSQLQPTTTRESKQGCEKPSQLNRSQSVQERRASDRSWVTASVATSVADSKVSSNGPDRRKRNNQYDHTFDTIIEEAALPRDTSSNSRNKPVSPVIENDYPHGISGRSVRNRSGMESPISPLSPTFPSPSVPQPIGHDHRHCGKKVTGSRFQEDLEALQAHETPGRPDIESPRRSHSTSQSRVPKISSRLSRPFDGPAGEAGTFLDSVRRPKNHSIPRRSQSHRETNKSGTIRQAEGLDGDRSRNSKEHVGNSSTAISQSTMHRKDRRK